MPMPKAVTGRTTASVFMVLTALSIGPTLAAQTSVTLQAVAIDSMYPNVCSGAAGCFPSKLPDGSLGFTGSETIVAWRNVNFPGNPVSIGIEYASTQASSVQFYFGGGPNDDRALFWWFCDLPTTGSYGTVLTSTCLLDYGLLGDIDLSGTHDLYLGFSCAGAGCGNYKSFTFSFDGSGANGAVVSRTRASTRKTSTGTAVAIGATNTIACARSVNSGSVRFYDIRGRQIGNLASLKADGRQKVRSTGVFVARPVQ